MTEQTVPTTPTATETPASPRPIRGQSGDLRHVTLTRDSLGRYTVRNDRGGSITTSSGTDELSPVELLLAGIAACTAVDVDTVTTRRAEPESFQIDVTADKVKDEQGNHLEDIEITFRVRFPDGDGGDAARQDPAKPGQRGRTRSSAP